MDSLPVAPNLLDRDFTAKGPNEHWVGDVTYLRTPQGTLYMATILDLYSRIIVGWATSASNDRRHKTIGQISPREFERRHAAAYPVGPVAPTASGPPFGRPSDVGRSGHLAKEVIDRIEVTV